MKSFSRTLARSVGSSALPVASSTEAERHDLAEVPAAESIRSDWRFGMSMVQSQLQTIAWKAAKEIASSADLPVSDLQERRDIETIVELFKFVEREWSEEHIPIHALRRMAEAVKAYVRRHPRFETSAVQNVILDMPTTAVEKLAVALMAEELSRVSAAVSAPVVSFDEDISGGKVKKPRSRSPRAQSQKRKRTVAKK